MQYIKSNKKLTGSYIDVHYLLKLSVFSDKPIEFKFRKFYKFQNDFQFNDKKKK